MKTEHYPSLELCKKLSDINFPNTEVRWFENQYLNSEDIPYISDEYPMNISIIGFPCPSVIEMLDVIPSTIPLNENEDVELYCGHNFVAYTNAGHDIIGAINGILLPNALASMILWLHENNYISFTK